VNAITALISVTLFLWGPLSAPGASLPIARAPGGRGCRPQRRPSADGAWASPQRV